MVEVLRDDPGSFTLNDLDDLDWRPVGAWPTATQEPAPAYIPEPMSSLYLEAATCLHTGCFRAAAIMIRGTLDAAMNDKKATGKTLHDKINSMTEELRPQLLRAAKALKLGGNAAAHDFSTDWTEEKAALFFRFLGEVLRELYEVPPRLDELQALAEGRP